MNAATIVMMSVLFPAKGWFAPDQAWQVNVRPPAGTTVVLMMTDFAGQSVNPDFKEVREFAADATVDLKKVFPSITTAGAYILYALPKNQEATANMVGTPLVVSVRDDRRRGAPPGPMVVKVDPLRFAIVSTDSGDMTVAFYYDVAPNTIANFLRLAEEKFYDGLTFHRIDPDFVVQGGDPRGDGTGGPGYTIDAEFSDRKHELGAISMARATDPNESPANPPRPEYANSAGSQFMFSLNYKNTVQLDGQWTLFGRAVGPESLKTLAALSATPLADKKTGKPVKSPVIRKIEVRPVTREQNPYRVLLAKPAE